MPTSQNGWPVFTDYGQPGLLSNPLIPGTRTRVLGGIRDGDVATVLLDFLGWFDRTIEDVDQGQDDWGYNYRPIRGQSTGFSNHASGTAVDVNALKHPLHRRGTFTADQMVRIRAKLREYDGVIRWGGDYSGRPDEMHFEINAGPAAVAAVAARIRRGTAGGGGSSSGSTGRQPYTGGLQGYGGPGIRSGAGVRRIQTRLNTKTGAGLTVDGLWGPRTEAAVRAYQQRHLPFIVRKGRVGRITWNSLEKP